MKRMLAYAAIYLLWGSTFLAIRIGVREVPPFLLAAMRFLAAGLALYGWMLARGARAPSGRQWMSAFGLAVLIFVLDYGLLFWAQDTSFHFCGNRCGDGIDRYCAEGSKPKGLPD